MTYTIEVYGFRPRDEEYDRFEKVYDACMEAGVSIPTEVTEFFYGGPPGEYGYEFNLQGKGAKKLIGKPIGFEVNLDEIPKGIKSIEFYVIES